MPFLAPIIAAVTGFLAAHPIIGFIVKAAISIGLQYALNALRPDQPKPEGGTSISLEFGADQPRRVCFGLCLTAGRLHHAQNYGEANKYLQRVIALSDYPVDGFGRVSIDGLYVELATEESGDLGYKVKTGEHTNYVWIKLYDGRQAVADPGLLAKASSDDEWADTAIGTGVAYAVVTQLYDIEAHYATPQCLFEVYGARLYDWRKDDTVGGVGDHRWDDPDTHEFSENPAVIEFNYRRGLTVAGDAFCGMGMAQSDLSLEKFTTAANICDEDVDSEARFRASLIASSDVPHRAVIEALATSSGAMIVDGPAGSWPIIGTEREIVATLDDDDIIDGSTAVYRAKRSMADLVNAIAGTYSEPESIYQPVDYDIQTDDALVTIDRRSRDITMDFPMVPSKRQANQLAATYLSENRFEKVIGNLTVRPRWRALEVGDWIEVASDIWGTATYVVKSLQVLSPDKDGARNVVLDLEERDSAIYADPGVVSPVITPPSDLVTEYLEQVQSLQATATIVSGDNGYAVPALYLSWAATEDPTVKGVEVQYRPLNSPATIFSLDFDAPKTIAYITQGIVQQTEYQVRTILLTTGRVVTATAWQTVTTSVMPTTDVTVYLSNLQDDAKDILKGLQTQVDDLVESVQVLAAGGGSATIEQTIRSTAISVATANAAAAVIEEATARVSGDEAVAAAVTALEASLDESLASGLMKIEATVDEGGASASIAFYARITTNDEFKETGLVLEVYTDGPDIKSRTVLKTDSFIVTDGTDSNSPFAFVDGELALALANIGTITAGTIQSADGLMQIDLAAPLISMDDGI